MSFRERPILFSAPMVRAILDGRKTQTRRVVKPQPDVTEETMRGLCPSRDHLSLSARVNEAWQAGFVPVACPYGGRGDRLWVRERFNHFFKGEDSASCLYLADAGTERWRQVRTAEEALVNWSGWKPSIHMPRWASRLTLEVTRVRVERLHDITGADLLAEGIAHGMGGFGAFEKYWDSLHAKGDGVLWASNPWVWVIEFRCLGTETSDEKQSAVSI